MIKHDKQKVVVGWIAVGLSTTITSVWAFWGIIENFHEGWYHESWFLNLGMMFVQYLSPMLLFMGVTLITIYRRRFGVGLHILLALLAVWFFQAFSNAATFLLILPLIGIGLLYWYGRPKPRKVAVYLAVGLPLLTLIISGIGPVLRVSKRFDDGNIQARLVHGNEVDFIWAPEGPGWPHVGLNWEEAQKTCQYLSENGLTLADESLNIWRLPTVDEAVRSMARHGQNSGGEWDDEAAEATYITEPDKESPLWNIYSQVIYWWTATEADEEHAYIIVYDGSVWSKTKIIRLPYQGFRCIKLP